MTEIPLKRKLKRRKEYLERAKETIFFTQSYQVSTMLSWIHKAVRANVCVQEVSVLESGAVARTLIGGGGVYSYIRVMPD